MFLYFEKFIYLDFLRKKKISKTTKKLFEEL